MRAINVVVLALLASQSRSAIAGDPTAHTAAMVSAARQVSADPAFSNGVGGPRGTARPGLFQIPLGEDVQLSCAYQDSAEPGTAAARRARPTALQSTRRTPGPVSAATSRLH